MSRTGDQYMHFKGGKYTFLCIALPKEEYFLTKDLVKINAAHDAATPDGEDIRIAQLYGCNGIIFIDREVPHVIYQSHKDAKWWARPVDDFFGWVKKPNYEGKRFIKQ